MRLMGLGKPLEEGEKAGGDTEMDPKDFADVLSKMYGRHQKLFSRCQHHIRHSRRWLQIAGHHVGFRSKKDITVAGQLSEV